MDTQNQLQRDVIQKRDCPPLESFPLDQGVAIVRSVLQAGKSGATITVDGQALDGASGIAANRRITSCSLTKDGAKIAAVQISTTGVDDAVAMAAEPVLMPDLVGMFATVAQAILSGIAATWAAQQGEPLPISYLDTDGSSITPPFSAEDTVYSTNPPANSQINANGIVATILIHHLPG